MKKTVALIFGGKNSEHEVSMKSAKNVFEALDPARFDTILVGISKEGSWYRFASADIFTRSPSLHDRNLPDSAEPVTLISYHGEPVLFSLKTHVKTHVHCAFPVLHGTLGEDGAIQGLFKMAHIPFVGCGVLASAAGMDKDVMKRLMTSAGIRNAKSALLTPQNKHHYDELVRELGTPFFIKPANAGSSVGVHKIKTGEDFVTHLKDSFLYDNKVLAEEYIQGREIECSVLGLNHNAKASIPGEIIPQHEFYSYEAKYLDDNGAVIKIPAVLSSDMVHKIQEMAVKTFQIMGCDGLTRVDFFVTKNNEIYVNEVNTLPGFTNISMYPKMWEASGVKYKDLVTKLVDLAFEKYEIDNKLVTTYLDLN
jgi:D-alanine-D-alanine ligase